mmetsp:Transcript_14067/g.51108  ORF Transcript_14067/g.51108 Transcript_14067/m.51108 type:complete len:163 (+) Transcript_14067:192-680(+)
MAQYYEVVVFSDAQVTYVEPIVDGLDPKKQFVAYRLYRDATKYMDGVHVRDLSKLNRDLSRVVLVSAKPTAYRLQPENALRIKPWRMEQNDTALLDLMPLLESIVRQQVPDVRTVMASFKGVDAEDIPKEFRERHQRMMQQRQQLKERGPARRLGFLRGAGS